MKIVNLKGQVYGRLTVLERTQATRGGSVLWQCLCECGSQVQVSTRHLNRVRNTVRSCGCLKLVAGNSHKDWKGCGDISGNWWSTHIAREFKQKSRAKIPVELTIEEAWNLFMKQEGKCALTKLDLVVHNSFSKNTASIDRIDSAQGYVLGNVQWVHKDINMMKNRYDNDYFIRMCTLVAGGVCPVK